MDEEFAEIAHPKKRAFLAAFAESGLIGFACECAGCHRNAPAVWRHVDPQFAAGYERAKESGYEVLESVAAERAMGYTTTKVWLGPDGKETRRETTTKVSNSLLIFLLKGARPATYRDHHEVDGDRLREMLELVARLVHEQLGLREFRSFRLELAALAERAGVQL